MNEVGWRSFLSERDIPNRNARGGAIVSLAFALVWAVAGLAQLGHLLAVVPLALSALTLILGLRSRAIGLDVTDAGVTSITTFRSRSWPWSDIESFEKRGSNSVGARLRSGERVSLQRYAFLSRERDEVVASLRAFQEQHRG